MPGESSDVPKQSISTEVSPQKQDELPTDESTSIPPIELPNGVKRPLLNESEDGEEVKKMKLTENVNEEEFEVSSLNDKNNKEEENHIDIDKNLDKITENNSDDNLCVSDKNNIEKDTPSIHIDDKASNIDTNDQNKCTNDINKPSNTNIENDNCEPVISKTIINGTESESVNTDENVLIQDDQITNDNSLQLKIPLDNLDNEDEDVDKIPLLTERLEVNNESKLLNNNSFTNESEIKNIENVQLSPVSNTHLSVTESTDETTMMESDHNNYTAVEEVSNNNDNDCVFIESDSNSDMDDDELLDNLLKNNKKYGKQYFPNLLKFFSQKNLTYEQFENHFFQLISAQVTNAFDTGKQRYKIQLLTAREKQWKNKYMFLVKQMKELAAIVKLHTTETKDNVNAKPHIITRTVGLQATLDIKKDYLRLPRTITPSLLSNNESVDITNVEDDDVIPLAITENTKPSTSNLIENKTPKKKLCSLNPSPVKEVPPAMPLPLVNNGPTTIDLTGPDEVNILNVEKSPIKIIQRVSPSSPQLSRNLTTAQVVQKGVTFIELPHNIPPSSSGFIVRSSSAGSTPLTTVANVNTTNKNVSKSLSRPFLIKDGRLLPIQLSTASTSQLQSGPVTFARQLPPVSQFTGALQPVPPSIPLPSVLKHPAPLPSVPNQKSLISWKKIPPAPVVTLSRSLEGPSQQALVLSWNMNLNNTVADIFNYQIYAYQEISSEAPRTENWRKIGDVKALPLPMACSLTQYMCGEKYHFAVRATDKYNRVGPFSLPHCMP